VKHISGAPLYGRLLASLTKIRLGWKGLSRTSLKQKSVNYDRKKFYRTGPRALNLMLGHIKSVKIIEISRNPDIPVCPDSLKWVERHRTGENLKVVLAEFSTISWTVLLHSNDSVLNASSHF
jgi:hypothetical protein